MLKNVLFISIYSSDFMLLEMHFKSFDYDIKTEFHEDAVDFLCKSRFEQ
jgi:hypothetical protein